MATKAEEYMSELLRASRPPKPKKVRKPSRDDGIDSTLLKAAAPETKNGRQ